MWGRGRGGRLLTVGMSATLWVIKKEMPIPPPAPQLKEADLRPAGELEPEPGLITEAKTCPPKPHQGEGDLG